MVKHNNVVPNGHFHKDWQRYVKLWFDQPAKKVARRQARDSKVAKVAPRPINLLRPVVRGQTLKYNLKSRSGRGFTLFELQGAGIPRKEARGIGISVDHRRKNRNEEGFKANVNRLKLYKSKLVVFPRKPSSKRLRKGDSSAAERNAVEQTVDKQVLSLPTPSKHIKARVITKEERERNVTALLRKERTDAKLWGQREARAKAKAAVKVKPAADAGKDDE